MLGINNFALETLKIRNHKDVLKAMSISVSLNQVATCGDNTIKILDLSDLKATQDIVTIDEERGNLEALSWSCDGQFLSVTLKRYLNLLFNCLVVSSQLIELTAVPLKHF